MKSILRCFISPYPNPIGATSIWDVLKVFALIESGFWWSYQILLIIAFTLNLRNNLVKRVLVRVYCGVGFIVLFGLFLPCNRKDVGIVRNKENIGHGNGLTWSVVAAFINCCKHCRNIPFIAMYCFLSWVALLLLYQITTVVTLMWLSENSNF